MNIIVRILYNLIMLEFNEYELRRELVLETTFYVRKALYKSETFIRIIITILLVSMYPFFFLDQERTVVLNLQEKSWNLIARLPGYSHLRVFIRTSAGIFILGSSE